MAIIPISRRSGTSSSRFTFIRRITISCPRICRKDDIEVTDALGKQSMAHGILYYPALPPGNKVRDGMDGFDLMVSDVPALTG